MGCSQAEPSATTLKENETTPVRSDEGNKNHHEWFVGSIDQGTTSSRFLIFNKAGEPVAKHQIEFENLYPQSG
jgi:hypothetical protein